MRFRLVTYEGGIKQGYKIRDRSADYESKAQFGFGHLGAAFWFHTRPEIKTQFGSRYLSAVQILMRFDNRSVNNEKKKNETNYVLTFT